MFNKEKTIIIEFNNEKCTKCGLCIENCPGEYLIKQNNEIVVNTESQLGCIQCGNCMMACPNDAISVTGEGISKENVFYFNNNLPEFAQLLTLLKKRRSARSFKNKEVPTEVINQILDAASTGAISIPPSEVKVLVIQGFDKVQRFKNDLFKSIKKMSKIFTPFVMAFLRPFIGKNDYKIYKEFVIPLFKSLIEADREGKDYLLYNAPVAIIFYTTAFADKEDAIIASTLANTAAESLGLSCCVIGSVAPVINSTKEIKEKYGINKDEKAATAIILGYPNMNFKKGINRDFKEVRFY